MCSSTSANQNAYETRRRRTIERILGDAPLRISPSRFSFIVVISALPHCPRVLQQHTSTLYPHLTHFSQFRLTRRPCFIPLHVCALVMRSSFLRRRQEQRERARPRIIDCQPPLIAISPRCPRAQQHNNTSLLSLMLAAHAHHSLAHFTRLSTFLEKQGCQETALSPLTP